MPPVLSVKTGRFTIERRSYLRAMWLSGLAWRPFALLGLLALGSLLYGLDRGLEQGSRIAAVSALAFLLGFVLRYLRARRDVYGRASQALFDDPRTMEISERGISTRTEGGIATDVPWTSINRAAWRGGFTLLYFSRIGHLVVPDAAFRTSGDREAFLTILRSQSFPRFGL